MPSFFKFKRITKSFLFYTARNYGYAKFATKDCAMRAIQVLHGQNLAGNRLKVLEAEPPKNDSMDHSGADEDSKRPRY